MHVLERTVCEQGCERQGANAAVTPVFLHADQAARVRDPPQGSFFAGAGSSVSRHALPRGVSLTSPAPSVSS
jgi:hypothetical protein